MLNPPPRPRYASHPTPQGPRGVRARSGPRFPPPPALAPPAAGGLGRQVGRARRGRSPGAAAGGRLRAAGRAHNSGHCLGPADGAGAAVGGRAPGWGDGGSQLGPPSG